MTNLIKHKRQANFSSPFKTDRRTEKIKSVAVKPANILAKLGLQKSATKKRKKPREETKELKSKMRGKDAR